MTQPTEHTSAMIALVPSSADLDRLESYATEPRDELHLTLFFLGDAATYDTSMRQMINDAVAQVAVGKSVVNAQVFGAALWNPDSPEPALVLNVGGDDLDVVHDAVDECLDECISGGDDIGSAESMEMPDQHEPWVPHVTLGYSPTPDQLTKALDLVGPITFDRLRVAFGGETTDTPLYRSTGAAASGTDALSTGGGNVVEGETFTHDHEHFAADVDTSKWDAGAAMAGCSDAPCYRAIAFETNKGTPDQRQHWALPHHKSPGAAPNADGVRAALAALGGARNASVDLKNEAAARSHLEAHMKTINPDYKPAAASDDVAELAGTKPKTNTPADKRLKQNKTKDTPSMIPYDATDVVTPDTNLADISGTPWQGVLVVEGVETGDGRLFAEGSLTWDDPPVALRWAPTDEGQHKGAVVVARIDNIWRDQENPAIIRGEGVFDDQGTNGAEALRLIRGKFLSGVSVDVDSVKDADVELVFPSADAEAESDDASDVLISLFQSPEMTIFHAGRIRAATLVDVPAFVEAQVWLTDGTMAMPEVAPAPTGGFAALDTMFAHNCGGDINITACAVGVSALLRDPKLPISLARRRTMYDHLAAHLQAAGLTPQAFDPLNFSDGMLALVAGLVPQDDAAPPAAWFTDPELTEPTPLTITDEGQIYGHGALWNSCHTGFGNACVSPPREGAHTYYRQGELVTLEGHHVAVGHITLGTGHAPTYGVDSRQALEHYDNTGTVVADVISGEDRYGIWVAGALRPGLSAARVRELRGAKLSGDWRRIGGQLRLVAFLAVNVPGFGVPRLRAEVESGRQLSLVASGVMRGNELEERERAEERQALNNIREHLQRKLGLTPAERAQALRRRVLGDVG